MALINLTTCNSSFCTTYMLGRVGNLMGVVSSSMHCWHMATSEVRSLVRKRCLNMRRIRF